LPDGGAVAQPIDLPDCAKQLLQVVYPTVDWTRVTFYCGLPKGTSSNTAGMTFPDPDSFSNYRVYLKNADFCVDTGDDDDPISTLIHEAFHVQQYMCGIGRGYGIGLLRPGFFNYQACCINGYDNNPFEQAAIAQEKRFGVHRRKYKLKICECANGTPLFNASALDFLVRCETEPSEDSLIVREPRIPPIVWGPWWKVALGYIGATIMIPVTITRSAGPYLLSVFKQQK
jgi:hypothetical protein